MAGNFEGIESPNCQIYLHNYLSDNIAWRQAQQNEASCEQRVTQPPYIQGRHTRSPQAESSLGSEYVCNDGQEVGETLDENLEATVSDCDAFEKR